MLLWGNLSEEERDRYNYLLKIVSAWSSYCSLSKTGVIPYEPTDNEFFECEMLAMKGWGMI